MAYLDLKSKSESSYRSTVIIVGLLPCQQNEAVTKELFKKASNGLHRLSRSYRNCYFIPIAKSFIAGGKIDDNFFRDGVHLTLEGSRIYSDVLCKRLFSLPKKPCPERP
jgi:hypothetical protein